MTLGAQVKSQKAECKIQNDGFAPLGYFALCILQFDLCIASEAL